MDREQLRLYQNEQNLTIFLRHGQLFTRSRIQELSDFSIMIVDGYGALVGIDVKDISWIRAEPLEGGAR